MSSISPPAEHQKTLDYYSQRYDVKELSVSELLSEDNELVYHTKFRFEMPLADFLDSNIEMMESQRDHGAWSLPLERRFIGDFICSPKDIPALLYRPMLHGGRMTLSCIDGQHRTRALEKFFNESGSKPMRLPTDFAYRHTLLTGSDVPRKNMTYAQLSDAAKQTINQLPVTIEVFLSTDNSDYARIFQKVNSCVALNPVEKLGAMGGTFVAAGKRLRKHSLLQGYSGRMSDLEVATTALALIHAASKENPVTEPLATEGYSMAQKMKLVDSDDLSKESEKQAKRVLDLLHDIVESYKLTAPELFSKGMLPRHILLVDHLLRAWAVKEQPSLILRWYEQFANRYNNLRGFNWHDFKSAGANATKARLKIYTRLMLKDWEKWAKANGIPKLDANPRFSSTMRVTLYNRQQGCCDECCEAIRDIRNMEAHHVVWYCRGGRTNLANARGLCKRCHIEIHREGAQIVSLATKRRVKKVISTKKVATATKRRKAA